MGTSATDLAPSMTICYGEQNGRGVPSEQSESSGLHGLAKGSVSLPTPALFSHITSQQPAHSPEQSQALSLPASCRISTPGSAENLSRKEMHHGRCRHRT